MSRLTKKNDNGYLPVYERETKENMNRLTWNAEMNSEYKYIVKGNLGLLTWGAKFRDKKQADDYIDRMNEEASPYTIDWEVEKDE